MKVERRWKHSISCAWVVCLLVIAAVAGSQEPVSAAVKSYVLQEGKTATIQLDGKGAKEKIKFVVQSEQNPDKLNSFGSPTYHNTMTLYVNDTAVYEREADTQRLEATGQVYVTLIDKNDKVRDIFVALTEHAYTGEYLVLDYCRYNSGKMKKTQDIKKYLDEVLPKDMKGISKECEKYYYYHSMNSLDESLQTSGNRELFITIDLPSANNQDTFGEYHAEYALKLKNGKLVKKYNDAKGNMNDFATIVKKAKFYTVAGGTKTVFTAKSSEDIYLVEYKCMKNKLYIKGQNKDGKEGWICSENLNAFTGNHI